MYKIVCCDIRYKILFLLTNEIAYLCVGGEIIYCIIIIIHNYMIMVMNIGWLVSLVVSVITNG